MSRTSYSLIAALSLLAACGPKTEKPEADPNLTTTVDPVPQVPRSTQIQIGMSADSTGFISGVTNQFKPTDTVVVAVTTQDAGMGAKVESRLISGKDHVAMAEQTIASVDSTRKGLVVMKLVAAKPLAAGKYQVEVLIDGKSQAFQDIEIIKP